MRSVEADRSRNSRAEEARYVDARAKLTRSIASHTKVHDERVLGAFLRVPRHLFVPLEQRGSAYEDSALPIGHGQTISQPSMIAIMLGALDVRPEDHVLEIGAGSGYAAALLAELAHDVYAVEIVPALAAMAQRRVEELRIPNLHVISGNGRQGHADQAPYDKILVSAGSGDVPAELVAELAPRGRMAIPVGNDVGQELLVGTKDDTGTMHWERSIPCIFVPLVGQAS